jgi:D-alanyl-D-alanine carboxypeptidase
MKVLSEKFSFSKKWFLLLPLAAALLIYPVLAFAPSGTTASPTVLSSETVSPLGTPELPPQPAAPHLEGELNLDNIQAKSFLVYDVSSGAILADQETNQPVAIASLTKLMTALVVYENMPSFKETITVTPKDLFAVEPSLGLVVGDQITVGDLFYAMLVGSANDAALALANHVETETGQNFIELMNATAKKLGMTNTHFSNPLGFDSEANYSTANDLHQLVQAVQERQAFSLVGRNQSYSFASVAGNKYSVKATNTLIGGNKGLYAIKTGFTNLAQGAMITESREPGHSFIIIVLDSPNRENDTLALRSQILKNYVWLE